MDGIRQTRTCGRAIVMVALAYLFVLQGLLAPAAILAASATAATAGLPLCDDPAMADQQPGTRHEHAACCDLGCLPHKAGLSLLALPPPPSASLPSPLLAPGAEFVARADGPWAPTATPGLPGARAPPSAIA